MLLRFSRKSPPGCPLREDSDGLLPAEGDGAGGSGTESLFGGPGPGPVCESDGGAEDVVDIGDAGGILKARPETQAAMKELSVSDPEGDVTPDSGLLGHGEVDSGLDADIPGLRQRIEAQQPRGYRNDQRLNAHSCGIKYLPKHSRIMPLSLIRVHPALIQSPAG